jgi:hypothetical protein
MQPSTLNISAPFTISGLSITIKYLFDLFMTHTKSQLLTLRKHLVTASQSQLCLKPIGPVVYASFCLFIGTKRAPKKIAHRHGEPLKFRAAFETARRSSSS